jgi:hypothetical protein
MSAPIDYEFDLAGGLLMLVRTTRTAAHVHARIFIGTAPGCRALAGRISVAEYDWPALLAYLRRGSVSAADAPGAVAQ